MTTLSDDLGFPCDSERAYAYAMQYTDSGRGSDVATDLAYFKARYTATGERVASLAQVGRWFGVSREWARVRVQRVLDFLQAHRAELQPDAHYGKCGHEIDNYSADENGEVWCFKCKPPQCITCESGQALLRLAVALLLALIATLLGYNLALFAFGMPALAASAGLVLGALMFTVCAAVMGGGRLPN